MILARDGDTAPTVVSFYAGGLNREELARIDFYEQDIRALESLGLEVRIDTSIRQTFRRADLYFIWWWTRAMPTIIAAKIRSRPAIVTGTFNWERAAGPSSYLARPWVQRMMIRLSARLASVNLMVSERERALITEGLGLTNTRYFPHAVQCITGCRYPYSPTDLKTLFPRGDISAFVLNLAWSGRANLRRKCVYELVEAFEAIAHEVPATGLVLAGNVGDGSHDLRRRCELSPAADQIAYLGRIGEVAKHSLLRDAAVYASPSRFEGFGLAIAEAAAHGASVVTSDVGAVREVLGEAARYCDGESVSSIANVLRSALAEEVPHHWHSADLREYTCESKLQRLRLELENLEVGGFD